MKTLGSYRQREIVDQYSEFNHLAVLPKTGVPLGNIATSLGPSNNVYGRPDDMCFPKNERSTNAFAVYDRWAEVHNVTTEFVHLNTARALASAAYLVNSPNLRTQAWKRADAAIVFTNGTPAFGVKSVAQLNSTQDLAGAEIIWDPARSSWSTLDQNPAIGGSVLFYPTNTGDQRTLAAEAVLPDGRRLFATVTNLSIWDPVHGGTNFSTDGNTVALYHFDSTNNAFADSSGNPYTLSIHTNVPFGVFLTTNANWMKSPTGYMVARFVGPGNYLDVQILTNHLPLLTSSQLTIEARIYPRSYSGSSLNILLLKQVFNNPSYATQWGLYYASGQAPDLYANCCPMLTGSQLAPYLTPNTWHQFKLTFAGGVTSAYVDGVPVGTSTNAPVYNLQDNWTLTLGNFDGDIDEVRISNTVR